MAASSIDEFLSVTVRREISWVSGSKTTFTPVQAKELEIGEVLAAGVVKVLAAGVKEVLAWVVEVLRLSSWESVVIAEAVY